MRRVQLRSLQGIVITALFALTACDVKETGGGGSGGDPKPQPIPCEPGFHVESVCDDTCNQPCKDECVPDSVCPEGTVEQWTCVGPAPPYDVDVVCDDGMDCPPPPDPGGCYLE